MFSLIIAIVTIALVVAVVGMTAYYGGSSLSDATAQAEAARLKNEEQQLLGAADFFLADQGRWPNGVDELVARNYLNSVPKGVLVVGQAGAELPAFISKAHAQAAEPGWRMPAAGVPIFTTNQAVPVEVCRRYNLASRGDDGVLSQAYTSQTAQCYGVDGTYRIVALRASVSGSLATALTQSTVVDGAIPPVDAGGSAWAVRPGGQVNAPTNPAEPPKVPKALVELQAYGLEAFGSLSVGQSVVSSPRTIFNTGDAEATGLSISAPAGFSVVNSSCGSALPASASCSFSVQFSPTQAQAYAGTVAVASSNAGSRSFEVSGTGEALVAALSLSGGTENFGMVELGQSKVSSLFTLSNTGNGPANDLSFTAPAGFTVSDRSCGAQLAAGASCTFTVTFAPSAAGPHSGDLHVASTGLVVNTAVSGEGQGVPKGLLASENSVDLTDRYASSGYKSAAIQYRNIGTAPMTLASPNLPHPLSVLANTCINVPVQGGCFIAVGLALNATPGTGMASISPTGAGLIAPVSVRWRLNGSVAEWSSALLAFPTKNVGTTTTQTVTLMNKGNEVANWSAGVKTLSGTGVFAFNMAACGAVQPQTSCAVQVTFTPKARATYAEVDLEPIGATVSNNKLGVGGKGEMPATAQVTVSRPAGVTYDLIETSASNESYEVYVPKGMTTSVTVSNIGGGSLAVEGSVTNVDGQINATCGQVTPLANGASCSWSVTVPSNMAYDSFIGSMWFTDGKKSWSYTFFSR